MTDSTGFMGQASIDRINADHAADAAVVAALLAVKPSWAKALIIAELHVDQSDSQSDYFGSKTVRTVALAWSKHTRDLFPELRKAAATFDGTAYLATGGKEHREKYSMGRGFYLAGDDSYNGWQIRKCDPSAIDRCTDIDQLTGRPAPVLPPVVAKVYPFPPAEMAALAPLAHVTTGAALQADIVTTLTALLARVKPGMYASDAYAAAATDADAIGMVVSKFFLWDGTLVLRMAQAALEDCNFKKESAIVGLMANEAEEV